MFVAYCLHIFVMMAAKLSFARLKICVYTYIFMHPGGSLYYLQFMIILSIICRTLFWSLSFKVSKRSSQCFRFVSLCFLVTYWSIGHSYICLHSPYLFFWYSGYTRTGFCSIVNSVISLNLCYEFVVGLFKNWIFLVSRIVGFSWHFCVMLINFCDISTKLNLFVYLLYLKLLRWLRWFYVLIDLVVRAKQCWLLHIDAP